MRRAFGVWLILLFLLSPGLPALAGNPRLGAGDQGQGTFSEVILLDGKPVVASGDYSEVQDGDRVTLTEHLAGQTDDGRDVKVDSLITIERKTLQEATLKTVRRKPVTFQETVTVGAKVFRLDKFEMEERIVSSVIDPSYPQTYAATIRQVYVSGDTTVTVVTDSSGVLRDLLGLVKQEVNSEVKVETVNAPFHHSDVKLQEILVGAEEVRKDGESLILESGGSDRLEIQAVVDGTKHEKTLELPARVGAWPLRPGELDDVRDSWAKDQIVELSGLGLVDGVGGKRFDPKSSVTRAQLAKLISRAATANYDLKEVALPTYRPAERLLFTDVPADYWADSDLQNAAHLGLMKGDSGRFRPGDPVTRAEMATILIRALGREGDAEAKKASIPFRDASAVPEWAKGSVALAAEIGLIRGYNDGYFRPEGNLSREEAAAMISRYLHQLPLFGGGRNAGGGGTQPPSAISGAEDPPRTAA